LGVCCMMPYDVVLPTVIMTSCNAWLWVHQICLMYAKQRCKIP